MKNSRTAITTLTRRSELVTLVPSTATAVTSSNSVNQWSEGRRKFLQVHQDRYLQRLAILRESLLRENKDFVKLNLPKNSDKSTGFWEAILSDFNDASLSKKFPHTKSHRSIHASLGGGMSDEKQRRGHLERLRRIRIMQMQRRLPPQLEPLHGIGLGAKKESKLKENKQVSQRIPPTAYHVDWMKGNHAITPIGDHEKAINSWTLKHLRTVDVVPENETADNFPNDIRSLLRRTRHSSNVSVKETSEEKEHMEVKTTANTIPEARQTSHSKRSKSTVSRNANTEPEPPPTPPPAPASTPSPQSPFMSEIISHHSASTSRLNTASTRKGEESDTEDITVGSRNSNLVDRSTSPIGFRLPHLKSAERNSAEDKPDSANSKRHIVVKIPHGTR
ncbi:uncharacterized protein LOC120342799 [Styela clava]